ncbi:MAG: SulP family inorganic anion transporter [Acidimicrobiia bacterium]|nr:SulP family inorganic anion transporter [Acidimicrobiia bacterium]
MSWSERLSADFPASIVVFLVALPLCMGISIASGVPPAAGLITGIVGGIVVGFLAGCPLQVSGPAAGLAVMVFEIVQQHGISMLGPIVLAAGFIQLAAGALRLGQLFRAIAPAVIFGMLAGIGVLIAAAQFHVMVDDKPRGNGLANLISIPESIYKGVWPLDGSSHHIAGMIGLGTLIVLVGWNQFAKGGLKKIPGSLVAVIVATAIAAIWKLPIQYISLPDNLADAINWPTLETMGKLLEGSVLVSVAATAFVASAETLLSATAVDKMHSGEKTKYDKELVAQGLGNVLCGLAGALPMTGVIVRSTANVMSGGKTRASAIMHGVWLLVLVVFAPFILKLVPTSSLAAILVFTGYKLVNPANIKLLRQYGWLPVGIYGATLTVIVVQDLLTGIVVGLVLSAVKLIYMMTHLSIRTDHDPSKNRVDLHLEGAATFLRLPALADALDAVPFHGEVHIHFGRLGYVDHAAMDVITDWKAQREKKGGVIYLETDHLMERYHQQNTVSFRDWKEKKRDKEELVTAADAR